MKLLVLGAAGMLGHRICRLLGEQFEIWGTFHDYGITYEHYVFYLQNVRLLE